MNQEEIRLRSKLIARKDRFWRKVEQGCPWWMLGFGWIAFTALAFRPSILLFLGDEYETFVGSAWFQIFHWITIFEALGLSLIATARIGLVLRRTHPDLKNLPLNAEFLLYLVLSKNDSEVVAGDLEERWRTIKKQFGVRRANFWYWTQVVRSIWPFGVAALKKRSGLVAVMELWRKMRG